jgi:protein ImuB
MLWLCLYFPRLTAEALNLVGNLAVAVAQRGSRRWLVTGAEGVNAGTSLASALSLQPRLSAHLRKPAAERERLRAIAHAAYRYGSPVCSQIIEPCDEGQLPLPLLWVEVGASLRVHGGITELRDALHSDLMELGTTARMALGPTRLGAALLAHGGETRPALTTEELQQRLAPLPLQVLPWPRDLLDTLSALGLQRLGEVMALPRAEFCRRFGARWARELDRIRGTAPHPFLAIHLPPKFERRFEFTQEIESIEGLLFPLRRLCVELQHYLRARASGVRKVRLTLVQARAVCSSLEHRYTLPHLLSTLRERLQRVAPGSAVRELRLSAEDFATPPAQQADLFAEGAPQLEWLQTLERLRARLGDEAVWVPAATGDHRPERAWAASAGPATAPPMPLPSRPAWLLRQPRPIPEPPHKLSGAERIEQGWWDGQGVRRDYYTAEVAGARAWVFQNLQDGTWHLHGWWA